MHKTRFGYWVDFWFAGWGMTETDVQLAETQNASQEFIRGRSRAMTLGGNALPPPHKGADFNAQRLNGSR